MKFHNLPVLLVGRIRIYYNKTYEYKLLQEFLTQLKRIKDDELIRLKRETSVIQDDMNQVESLLNNIKEMKIVEGTSGPDEEKHQKVPNLSTEGNIFYVFSIGF